MGNKRTSRKHWEGVKVGEVVKAPSGLLRVVRHIHGCHSGRTWLFFTIKHCSWTHRCYTLYTIDELRRMGYRRTGKSVRLKSRMDERIAKEIFNNGKPKLLCCAVTGIS